MPEKLKYVYNEKFIQNLANEIKKEYCDFKVEEFISSIFCYDWDDKELKDRMRHISTMLGKYLPMEYNLALNILKPVSEVINGGFEPMFFPDFVEVFGMEHYKESIDALEHFTKYSSSEFAIRPFIIKYGKVVMQQMLLWASSENYHVRRLATEGCRPRLPWAMALPEFKKDPTLVVEILEQLKDDESEYVRRSVANNINDIAKDNPDIATSIAKKWIGKNKNRDWVVKHACRTLLKKGDIQVLSLFGYLNPTHLNIKNFNIDKEVIMGNKIEFEFNILSEKPLGKLRVEYAMYFMKANGKNAKKVFSISESTVSENIKLINKKHSFKKISTRKYYKGEHFISIIINGIEFEKISFVLKKD
jgi:3-methyladenine DNA glycosylase AlkC